MKNQEIANLFYEMAEVLELLKVEWKPRAYRTAARNLDNLLEDISKIYKKDGVKALKKLPGIGQHLADKIEEYIKTGKIKEHDSLMKKIPKGVSEIMHIPGMGAKKAWRLHKELKITNIAKLKKSAQQGKIRKLEGFGAKSEEEVLLGIKLMKKSSGRILISTARRIAEELQTKLKSQKFVKKIEIAGSIRRMRETAKDIDLLVVSNNAKKVMNYFTKLENVKKIIAKGPTKSSVILKEGINCDLRVISGKSFGSAMQYFTGSKDHNVKLRQIAIKKGYKLNEYGLFRSKTNKYVCGQDEKEIYSKLGVLYPAAELRENTGELFAQKLPQLVKYTDIKGCLHNHSTWSDGDNSVEEMIKKAISMGHKYYAQTDHSKYSRIANGLDEKRLIKYLKEIKKIKRKYSDKIYVFNGAEVDILKNGKLDYDNKILSDLDIVIASVHFRFKMNKKDMTERILTAFSNEHVKIFSHPTGRLINERAPYEINFEKVFQAAKDNNVALEINAQRKRLDLKDTHIKMALEIGCKFSINTDSHSTDQMELIKYGIGQARRGWLEKKNIINTKTLTQLKKEIKLN